MWPKLTKSGKSNKRLNRRERARWAMRPLRFESLETRNLLSGDFFVVAGAATESVAVDFFWSSRNAGYDNEICVYKVSDAVGRVSGVAPGASSYSQAALNASQVVFASGQGGGAYTSLTFKGGDRLAFCLVQNSTRVAALRSPSEHNVFFSVDGVNVDGFDHCIAKENGNGLQLAFEDLFGGGDRDFNDAVIQVGKAGLFETPGAAGQTVDVTVALKLREAAYKNEIGFFKVDDARGAIGSILPGQSGYLQAALSRGTVLFDGAAGAGQTTVRTVGCAQDYVFYLVQNGSTAQALRGGSDAPPVFFSLAAANPDGVAHVEIGSDWSLGFEDLFGGGDRDFNDAVITVELGTPKGTPTDVTPPTITAKLSQDTGSSNTDRVTTNAAITGQVTDASKITQLMASIDGHTAQNTKLATNGTFTLAKSDLDALNVALTPGPHTLRLTAKDEKGNTSSPIPLTFTYHTATLAIDSASDTGEKGDFRTDTADVKLTGTTRAGATVKLERVNSDKSATSLGVPITVDSSGVYTFPGVHLEAGPNGLKITATDTAGNVDQTGATITLNRAPKAIGTLANIDAKVGEIDPPITLSGVFGDDDSQNQVVRVKMGTTDFDIQLFNTCTDGTPRTEGHAKNFLHYVEANAYDNMFFHRADSDFVLQGGGFRYVDGATTNFQAIPQDPAVNNEPGLPNSIGTVALARVGGQENSGTNQWFVNLTDNVTALDDLDGGFTVFGQVLQGGQKVVQALANTTTYPFSKPFEELPLKNFTGKTMQDAVKNNFLIVTDVELLPPLTYTVSSSDTAVTAALLNGQLTLSYLAVGTSTITVTATDRDGSSFSRWFTVTVTAAP